MSADFQSTPVILTTPVAPTDPRLLARLEPEVPFQRFRDVISLMIRGHWIPLFLLTATHYSIALAMHNFPIDIWPVSYFVSHLSCVPSSHNVLFLTVLVLCWLLTEIQRPCRRAPLPLRQHDWLPPALRNLQPVRQIVVSIFFLLWSLQVTHLLLTPFSPYITLNPLLGIW